MRTDEIQELIDIYTAERTPESLRRIKAALRNVGAPHRTSIEGVLLGSKPMRLFQIAEELGVPVSHIASTISRMLRDGTIVRVKRGTYAMVKHE